MQTSTRNADSGRMNRLHTRLALTGTVFLAPLLLVLIPGNWFDENAEGGLNRNVEPPDLPIAIHVGIASVATAALLACLVVLLSPAGRHAVCRSDVKVAGPLLLAGLYAAFTYRVSTAAVTGANIGAGMLFLLGVVITPVLVGLAGYNAWNTRRTSTQSRPGT